MGFIKEPEGIDLIIESKPLTDKQEKELSEYISTRKLEIKEQLKNTRLQKKRSHNDVAIP
jgi:hypothetical protein